MLEPPIIPLTLSVAVAGVLLGVSLPTAYRLAAHNALPLVPIPGRRRVVTAKLEQMLEIRITPQLLAHARQQVALKTKKAPGH